MKWQECKPAVARVEYDLDFGCPGNVHMDWHLEVADKGMSLTPGCLNFCPERFPLLIISLQSCGLGKSLYFSAIVT